MGVLVREDYFDGHYRVVLVDNGSERIYSIDVYRRLPREPGGCHSTLDVGGPARLCYLPLGSDCEAVIVVAGERVEVVNLRLRVPASSDPHGGDTAKARSACLARLEEALRGAGTG
ncbi:MAG: hypothetical protein GSR80_001503 [Desulfurococcales archaeon]|nr:hypothetical protein [Desulfurococcales archaeon]